MTHLAEVLSALADGELGVAEEDQARAHLATCALCRAELADTVRVRDIVRGLPPVDSPVSLGSLVAPVPAPVPARAPATARAERRWAPQVAAAAAAVAALVLATFQSEPPDAAPVAQLVQVHATSAVNLDPVSQMAPAAVPVSFEP